MLDPVKNFVVVQASTGYDAAAVSIALNPGQGAKLPQPSSDGAFNLVWYNSTDYNNPANDPNAEIVRVTARTTDTLTITRAQESTSASTKNTAGKTYNLVLSLTAKMVSDINNLGVAAQLLTGTIDGANTTFTIPTNVSGKTMAVCNGQILGFEGVNFTRTTTTIVYTTAPTNGYDATSHYLICIA